MKPTLLVGDYIIVDRFAYGFPCARLLCGPDGKLWTAKPKRGDVIVFRHPKRSTIYIKRLIGLPNDTIQMIDGIIQINGIPVKQEPNGEFKERYSRQLGLSYPRCENIPKINDACIKTQLIETLPNGVSYNILNITSSRMDNTGVYTVPYDHYFFLGDNRDNSVDSRFSIASGGVGFVPAKNLLAKADTIWFSSAGNSMWSMTSWRKDRYHRPVK